MKKFLALSIALILIISSGSMVLAEASDYDTSWGKDEINYMMEKGIVNGYPDGTFKPTRNMKKSEFYTVINDLMGLTEKGEVNFSDVNSNDWYYGEVAKGVKAGYILADTTLNAESKITRGEVARIIGFVFGIEENKEAVKSFTDHMDMPEALKGVIGGLKVSGLVKGYPDGRFGSNEDIKRVEVVKMLHSISGEIVNKEAVVSKDAAKNVLVNTPGVVLNDMTIEGNLYLTEGIGEGDVTLNNVTVKGLVSIKGGGANSVKINNSKINKILVNKTKGTNVRVVLENTRVNEVKTLNDVKLELTKGTEVKLVELKGTVNLVMEKGTSVDKVNTESKNITIKSQGNIGSIVSKEAIKVNDVTMKAGTEMKVEEGKATEVKAAADKPSDTGTTAPGPGPGPGLSEYDRIVLNHENRLERLQTTAISKLSELATKAEAEPQKDSITKARYTTLVKELEVEIDTEVTSILSSLKRELEGNGYSSTSELASLRGRYDSIKESVESGYRALIQAGN